MLDSSPVWLIGLTIATIETFILYLQMYSMAVTNNTKKSIMYRTGRHAVNLPYGEMKDDELRRFFMLSSNDDDAATGVYSVATRELPRLDFMTKF